MNGLEKRSVTLRANASRSARGSVSVGQDLLLDAVLHVRTDQRIVHALAHGLLARQVRRQHGHRVGAVQDPHLALAVRRHVRRPGHVQPGRRERQLAVERAPRFDHPGMEDLAGHQQVVLVTELRGQLGHLVLRVAGHDAIDQRVGEETGLVDPAQERVGQAPPAGRLGDRARERVAVALDQLARQHHQPALGRAAEVLKARVAAAASACPGTTGTGARRARRPDRS